MALELPVYLDNNATTPCDPRVLEAMLPFFNSNFGNAASRSHAFGWKAEEAVDIAREQIAQLIGSEPGEIIFTSGATEADNLALKGVFEMYAAKGNHIITSQTEHKAVLDTCKHLEKLGAEITYLPVNKEGLINLAELEAATKPQTIMIAIMYANNETGVIQPVKRIGTIAKKHEVIFFTDAVQAVGKIPVNVQEDGIDLMAMSAHKLYGPKGVGALYVRRRSPRVRLTAQMDGGGHEKGIRSGTLNVPGIVGFGKACELARLEMEKDAEHTRRLRDKLENALLQMEESQLNGGRNNRLPQVANISFKYVDGEALIISFNKSIAVSSGSACTSASIEPSHVLRSMGLSDEMAHASIRFGLGRFSTEAQVDFAISEVKRAVGSLREMNPLWEMHAAGSGIGS